MRLIDADEHECWACVHHATGKCDTWCEYGECFELRKDVSEAKTVDAVPVVRCKECKHSDLPSVMTMKYGKPGTLTCCNRYSPCNHRNVNKNDFCSYGEGEKND